MAVFVEKWADNGFAFWEVAAMFLFGDKNQFQDRFDFYEWSTPEWRECFRSPVMTLCSLRAIGIT